MPLYLHLLQKRNRGGFEKFYFSTVFQRWIVMYFAAIYFTSTYLVQYFDLLAPYLYQPPVLAIREIRWLILDLFWPRISVSMLDLLCRSVSIYQWAQMVGAENAKALTLYLSFFYKFCSPFIAVFFILLIYSLSLTFCTLGWNDFGLLGF